MGTRDGTGSVVVICLTKRFGRLVQVPVKACAGVGMVVLCALGGTRCLTCVGSMLTLLPPPSNNRRSHPSRLSLSGRIRTSKTPSVNLSGRFIGTVRGSILTLTSIISRDHVSRRARGTRLRRGGQSGLIICVAAHVSHTKALPLRTRESTKGCLCGIVGPCVNVTHLPMTRRDTGVRKLLVSLEGSRGVSCIRALKLTTCLSRLRGRGGTCVDLADRQARGQTTGGGRDNTILHRQVSKCCRSLIVLTRSCDITMPLRTTATFIGGLGRLVARAAATGGRQGGESKSGNGKTSSSRHPKRLSIWAGGRPELMVFASLNSFLLSLVLCAWSSSTSVFGFQLVSQTAFGINSRFLFGL